MMRFLLALVLAGLPLAAGAQTATPAPAPAGSAAGRAHDGGVVVGHITLVDYQRSRIAIDMGSRGRLDVSVMPSTSIQAKDPGYRSIDDLRAGERVQIFLSVAGGKYVAQIIRIQ